MALLIAAGSFCFAAGFCIYQFCDLMRRKDDEFPGQYDKPIWAAAILVANVFGAFAYFIMKPHPVPRSGDILRRQYVATVEKLASKPFEPS